MQGLTGRVSPSLLIGICLAAGLGLVGYSYAQIYFLKQDMAATASSTAQERAVSDQKLVELSDTLYAVQQRLEAVQDRLGGFEDTVGDISGTVGVLEKLSKTDPELLQKYSKVYFLNEHYVPERLTEIPQEYVYSDTEPELIHALVAPYLTRLLKAAKNADIELYVKSAYRSFDEQSALKASYRVVYGAGSANQFSADQGYSEHQLGTAVDFISTGMNGQLDGFDRTAAYAWLLKNAYKYGFVLSYPQNNQYYIYEPWHWRFVGEKLADDLHDEKKNFYDLEQRNIDEYLVDIFD